jgi:ABC-type transport system involved in multi-copper enzyme maturation permease subunit
VIRAIAEPTTGVLLGLRGLVRKELRTRSRGWRPMWLLTAYLGLLTVAVAGFLALAERGGGGGVPPRIGTLLFGALTFASVLMLAFITPALTVGAISGERERRTLDLLLVTRASALGLVGGKLLASLVYIVYLLAASLPAFALVYLFGGVPPEYLAVVLAIATVTALAHAALGLLLSAVLKRTVLASVLSYLLVLGVTVGLPIGWLVAGQVAQLLPWAYGTEQPTPAILPPGVLFYASPVLALVALLRGLLFEAGALGFGLSPAVGLPITQAIYLANTSDAVGRGGQGETILAWAPWVYQLSSSLLFTLASLIVSALAIAPVKPWQRARSRRGARSERLAE